VADLPAAGDLLAARRFAYAKAAADEGDFAAAAEILEQALERAPDWAAAWFALGEAREKLGDLDAAAEAFRGALRCDPADAPGAIARLALIGRGDRPPALPRAYVARLFDQYAPRFQTHLTKTLGYRGPFLIAEALEAVAPARRFARALDLGCGAGLMGEALRERIDHLTGVDLSAAMIEKARERGAYDALIVGDVMALLMRQPPAAFDVMLAADSLVYFGDLGPLFAAAATALTSDGLIAFSVESIEGEGFELGASMRFAHSHAYVEATARAAALSPLLIRSASARREAGRDAPGLICVFERTERPAPA
jgi:predicted TPR repeat methyltransferase